MMRLHTLRRGFTLLEMVVVLWALSILAFVGSTLILTAQKAALLDETATEQFGRLNELARLFRSDVNEASDTPERLDNLLAGPEVLILRKPDGSTVVYRMAKGVLERAEHRGDRERARRFPFNPRQMVVAFSRPMDPAKDKEKEKLVTLRLTLPRMKSAGRVMEIKAALGGNRL